MQVPSMFISGIIHLIGLELIFCWQRKAIMGKIPNVGHSRAGSNNWNGRFPFIFLSYCVVWTDNVSVMCALLLGCRRISASSCFCFGLSEGRNYRYLLEIKSSALCLKVACSQNAACLALTFRCPNKTAINIATSLFPTKYFHVQSADL